ncbi:hypothetical protein AB0L40_20995 [Patulibacter sp. NPDC049589]|uniref:hypothetical protein n=1 Tax=Patulibacter sp. NPDC049589 TaxID=3154731 RepID=UPI0034381FB6
MTDPLDDLRRFADFRAHAPAPTSTATDRAHAALAVAQTAELRTCSPSGVPRTTGLPRLRRPRIAGAGAAALAALIVIVVAAWPSRAPSTLDLLSQARAALAPDDQVLHYRVTVNAEGDGAPRGVIERAEGWVRGRPDRRTEGRELTRSFAPGRNDSAGVTESSWRPDTGDPRRTIVLYRSGTSGPATRRVVGSARPTASVFASSLDPRQDARWTRTSQTDDTIVLTRSMGGAARLTVELDRGTGLPRRFVAEDTFSTGGHARYVTTITTDELPATPKNRQLLTITAPTVPATASWGTPEATRLIERARRLLSPPDGVVTVRSRTLFVTRGPGVRNGRATRVVRRRGSFLFEHGLLLRGQLTAIRSNDTQGPSTTWIPDPRDPDRVLVREARGPVVSIERPIVTPVRLTTLGDRSDGWRVARRTARRIVLRSPARDRYSGGELVLDRHTGAILTATTTPGLEERHQDVAVTTVQRLTVASRPARPGDATAIAAKP